MKQRTKMNCMLIIESFSHFQSQNSKIRVEIGSKRIGHNPQLESSRHLEYIPNSRCMTNRMYTFLLLFTTSCFFTNNVDIYIKNCVTRQTSVRPQLFGKHRFSITLRSLIEFRIKVANKCQQVANYASLQLPYYPRALRWCQLSNSR